MGQLAMDLRKKEKQLMYDAFPQKLETTHITSSTRKEREKATERTSITGIVNVNRSWGCWGGTAALAFRYFFFLFLVECVYPLVNLRLEFSVC